jgi:hypothetical protein
VEVRTGLTDGLATEVTGSELREGQTVVVRVRSAAEAADAASPFTPQFFGERR